MNDKKIKETAEGDPDGKTVKKETHKGGYHLYCHSRGAGNHIDSHICD